MNFSITEIMKEIDPNYEMKPIEVAFMKELQKVLPQSLVRFARQTAVPNVFEAIIDVKLFYFMLMPEQLSLIGTGGDLVERYRYVMQGNHLIDQKEKKDLGLPLQELAAMIDIEELPLDKAIMEKRGTGEHKLYCFLDPTNRQSQHFMHLLKDLKDVTIYYFLTPLTPSDGQNAKICDAIWASPDPIDVMNRMINNEQVRIKITKDPTPIADVYRLAKDLCINVVPTFFYEDGKRWLGVTETEVIRKRMIETHEKLMKIAK